MEPLLVTLRQRACALPDLSALLAAFASAGQSYLGEEPVVFKAEGDEVLIDITNVETLLRGLLEQRDPRLQNGPPSLERLPAAVRQELGTAGPVAHDFDPYEFAAIPLVPPFPCVFLESRSASHWRNVGTGSATPQRWGVRVRTFDLTDPTADRPLAAALIDMSTEPLRWMLEMELVLELRRGQPSGTYVFRCLGLNQEGRLATADSDTGFCIVERYPTFGGVSILGNEELLWLYRGQTEMMLGFAVVALTLSNCKNLPLAEGPARAARHKGRHAPKTEWVPRLQLDLGVFRPHGESAGTGTGSPVDRVLHVVRGHFKTYTAENPLMGRVSGSFYWAAQARGARDGAGAGAAKPRRQRVRDASLPLGEVYRESAGGGPLDYEHARLQNDVASWLAAHGEVPVSPAPQDPPFDLAWQGHLAEVKTYSDPVGETSQIRQGLGQVQEYRGRIKQAYGIDLEPVLIVPHAPLDPAWTNLCANAGVQLIWPAVLSRLLQYHADYRANVGGAGDVDKVRVGSSDAGV